MRRVIFATLVLIGAIGLLLMLLRRPELRCAVSRPLTWSASAPTTPLEPDFTFDGGNTVVGRVGNDMPFALAVTDGHRWLAMPAELGGCSLVAQAREGAHHVLVFQYQLEGPGLTLELVATNDDGRSFEYLASVPVVNFGTMVTDVVLKGRRIELVVEHDVSAPVGAEWQSPLERLQGLVQPVPAEAHRLSVVSMNGGRSFRLVRRE